MDSIESIVAELVDKRFNDAVHKAVGGAVGHDSSYWSGSLGGLLGKKVDEIITQELEKRDAEIRTLVVDRIIKCLNEAKVNIHILSS